jgi:zinc and cadmium transporter
MVTSLGIGAWILAFSLAGSVGAAVGGGAVLLLPDATRKRALPGLSSYAAGTLLGAAFLGMLPQALEALPITRALETVLIGLICFFVLEKVVLWHHCHEESCEAHEAAGPLLLLGDAFHNFIDGVVIAAAFLVSVPLGLGTSLAVIAHEIPQEVGDLAVLLHGGYEKRRAFALNLLSSLTTIPGALLGFFALDAARHIVPYVIALSAASFIYIAVADVVPSLHRQRELRQGVVQIAALLAGIGTLLLVRAAFH